MVRFHGGMGMPIQQGDSLLRKAEAALGRSPEAAKLRLASRVVPV